MTLASRIFSRTMPTSRRAAIKRICLLEGRYPYSVGRVLSEQSTPAVGVHRFDLLPNDSAFWSDRPTVPTDRSIWALSAAWRVSPHLICLGREADDFSTDVEVVQGDPFDVRFVRQAWGADWTLWEMSASLGWTYRAFVREIRRQGIDADIRLSKHLSVPNEHRTAAGEAKQRAKWLADLNASGSVAKYAMSAGVTRMTAHTRARACGWYDQAPPVVRKARAALVEGQAVSEAYTALGYTLPPVLVARVADHAKAVGMAIVGGRLRKMPGLSA